MRKIFTSTAVVVGFSVWSGISAADYCSEARKTPLKAGDVITDIYWSDADSGRANRVCFRNANADAAETGGIGSWGGAQCEAERVIGYASKAWVIEETGGKDIVVGDIFGFDRHDRQVVSFIIDGQDWNETAIDAGVYKSWVFKHGKPLTPKPNYCQE